MGSLYKISMKNYFFILCISSLSIEYLLAPNLLAQKSGTYILEPLIFLFIFKVILWWGLWRVLRSFEGMTLLEIIKSKYGNIVGIICTAIFSSYLLFVQLILILESIFLIKQDILYLTPNYLIIFFILFLVLYALTNGITIVSRISGAIFYTIVILLLFSLILFKKIDYTNFFPLVSGDYKNSIFIGYFMAATFSGLECAGIYNKYLKKGELKFKTGVYAILFTEIVLAIYSLIVYGRLGKEMILKSNFSVISTISLMEIPIVNREEIIFSFISIFIALVALIIYAYSTLIIVSDLFKNKGKSKELILNIVIVGILGFSTLMIEKKANIENLIGYKRIFPIILIFIILLGAIKINNRNIKGGKKLEKK